MGSKILKNLFLTLNGEKRIIKISNGMTTKVSLGLKINMIIEIAKNAPIQALLVNVRIRKKIERKDKNAQKNFMNFLFIKVIDMERQRKRRIIPDWVM